MQQIIELIRERNRFVLAGHISPDGDAIGACFALAMALDKLGKQVQVILEPFAPKYAIIPGAQFLAEKVSDELEVDVFIALDCADAKRLGKAQQPFERAKITICIDHHATNTGFAQYNFIEPDASSTSEMVFRLIDQLTEPTPDIAVAVYAGIVGDTGGFRFNSTGASTMEITARLMSLGIPFTEIYNELMHMHRFAASKALGITLANSARTPDKRIVYSHITRAEMSEIGAMTADLDSIVEYLMSTRGAEAVMFVSEASTPGQVKVSLRSRGQVNVGRVAMTLGGGGHVLAAGATVEGVLTEVVDKALALLQQELAND